MLGFLNPVKTALYCAAAAGALALATAGYLHYKGLRADLDAWMAANGDRGLATERELPNPNAKLKAKD